MEHFLENTTNTHTLKAKRIKVVKTIGSTQVLEVKGEGMITHGEHGCIKTESPHIIKYIQQEYYPVTKVIENAYD
ncbi:MAG: hypothetical protein ACPGSD_12955 [Flavobacteriales bacterium]